VNEARVECRRQNSNIEFLGFSIAPSLRGWYLPGRELYNWLRGNGSVKRDMDRLLRLLDEEVEIFLKDFEEFAGTVSGLPVSRTIRLTSQSR
jgi:hypothetical protein